MSFLSSRRVSRRKRPLTRRRVKQLILLAMLIVSSLGGGVFLRGKVVSVADGDTLTVFMQDGRWERVRLYGVDCPETGQRGGADAAAFTGELALFEKAEVAVIDTDRYGRSVAIVTLPDGVSLNEALVRNGHAWVYGAYCAIPQCLHWKALEKEARKEKRGLWKEERPVPPWRWRKTGRRR